MSAERQAAGQRQDRPVATRGLDLAGFWPEWTEVLAGAVPHDPRPARCGGAWAVPGARPAAVRRRRAPVHPVGGAVAGRGARRGLLVGEATEPEGPDAPGLVVLSDAWEVESTTPGVERWLQELPDGDLHAGRLPSAVLSVAGRALRTAEHPDEPGQVAVARVLSRSGAWVVLHGAAMVAGGGRRMAVIVEPATRPASRPC